MSIDKCRHSYNIRDKISATPTPVVEWHENIIPTAHFGLVMPYGNIWVAIDSG